LEGERHGGVMGEIARQLLAPYHGSETAALDDVDVARGKRAVAELADAEAPRLAAHARRLLQVGRQIARGGPVDVPRLRIDEPYPAGLQAEEVGDESERPVEGLLDRRRAVERLGDRADDLQLVTSRPCHGWILRLVVVLERFDAVGEEMYDAAFLLEHPRCGL